MVKITRTYLEDALAQMGQRTFQEINSDAEIMRVNAAAHSAAIERMASEERFKTKRRIVVLILAVVAVIALLAIYIFPIILKLYASNMGRVATVAFSSVQEDSLQGEQAKASGSIFKIDQIPHSTTRENCVENLSYSMPCKGTHEFPNGSKYSGTWINGMPNGQGSLSFNGGGQVDGKWEDGDIVEVQSSQGSRVNPLTSVTYFTSVSGKEINERFGNVIVGHSFTSSEDQKWSSAYCYVTVEQFNGNLQVSLSTYDTPESPINLDQYRPETGITIEELKKLQDICPYKWFDFR